MYIITTGANTLRFNVTSETLYDQWIMEVKSSTYNEDVILADPVVNNDRYISFVITQVANPTLANAEMLLPEPGDYYFNIYNTASDKSSGFIIFKGIMRLEGTSPTDDNWTTTEEDTIWVS